MGGREEDHCSARPQVLIIVAVLINDAGAFPATCC